MRHYTSLARRLVGLSALAAVCAAGLGTVASAQSFNTNLVQNGDAEAGTTGGFTTTGGPAVVAYDSGGGFPSSTDPGPQSRGSFFFTGGDGFSTSTLFQRINVSALSGNLDFGSARFELSAYLGGFSGQGDNAALSVSFLSNANVTLGGASIGPVTNVERNDQIGLLYRSADGFVPVGTRFVDLTLTLNRFNGSYNDGYADNLSIVLSPSSAVAVPGPVIGAGLPALVGLVGLFYARRRKYKL